LTENRLQTGRLEFGEMKAAVALKPVEDMRGTRYSFKQAGEFGVGNVSWNAVLEASRETLAILSRDAAVAKELNYLPAVKQMAPHLSEQDQRIVAQLWTAFPNSWNAFARTATLAQVTAKADPASGAQHLSITFVGDKKNLGDHYPHVEKYLERMGDVMDATFVLENQTGQWATVRVDSKSLQMNLDMWLKDGRLLPARNGEPLMDALGQDGIKQADFQVSIIMRFRALGVVTTLDDWHMNWRYAPFAKGATFDGALKDKPRVSIDGRALGVMPASWLAHMPVDIFKIVDDFMSVVTESNNGQGALVSVGFDESDAEHAKVRAAASWDGLDNFFVRMGVSMVIDKVIPDAVTSEEIRGLLFDSQIAFSRDLEQFASNLEVANA
ncbi:MAG TPA: hypothetical protein VFM46_15300, partial [Pseudomonadales bacterium]|nr:hypothetical protein [Pseudomonadales bacterium]